MISNALVFLKNQLNAHLRVGHMLDAPIDDRVVFLDGERTDPVTFKAGAVTALLINIEEETALRPPDRFSSVTENGTREQVQPEIRLNLYVLFVARFKKYEEGLAHLSEIIQYFMGHRQFDAATSPELGEDLERLVVELVTMPFSEQNEVWNALRTTYLPSVLYRVKMVVFRDSQAARAAPITQRQIEVS